ncbi:hypothetical protein P4H65_03355 [Paenibacillus chitinolyticus]|uniref:hypothetical protein n=1 Tax=Paenibacillus chitinolyticus TaxID=79263 RepID=UPI002DBFF4FA|nr:hypothetical protein [Paenibacillus chitinolyticus]MEC0244853.1 hypothetical protein [Paenibacillus chitinolyticus]
MRRIFMSALLLVFLCVGYLFWSGTAQYTISPEGYPVPRNAILKKTVTESVGTIYVYTAPGIHQTDGLKSSYKRQIEKHGWTYAGDLSMGATYIFKKSDGTLLNVSIYEGEFSIGQLQMKNNS